MGCALADGPVADVDRNEISTSAEHPLVSTLIKVSFLVRTRVIALYLGKLLIVFPVVLSSVVNSLETNPGTSREW